MSLYNSLGREEKNISKFQLERKTVKIVKNGSLLERFDKF